MWNVGTQLGLRLGLPIEVCATCCAHVLLHTARAPTYYQKGRKAITKQKLKKELDSRRGAVGAYRIVTVCLCISSQYSTV